MLALTLPRGSSHDPAQTLESGQAPLPSGGASGNGTWNVLNHPISTAELTDHAVGLQVLLAPTVALAAGDAVGAVVRGHAGDELQDQLGGRGAGDGAVAGRGGDSSGPGRVRLERDGVRRSGTSRAPVVSLVDAPDRGTAQQRDTTVDPARFGFRLSHADEAVRPDVESAGSGRDEDGDAQSSQRRASRAGEDRARPGAGLPPGCSSPA